MKNLANCLIIAIAKKGMDKGRSQYHFKCFKRVIFKREGTILKWIYKALFKTQLTVCFTQGSKLKWSHLRAPCSRQWEAKDSNRQLVHSVFNHMHAFLCLFATKALYSFQELLLCWDIFCENCSLNFYIFSISLVTVTVDIPDVLLLHWRGN